MKIGRFSGQLLDFFFSFSVADWGKKLCVEGIKYFSPFQFSIVLLQLMRFSHSLWVSFLEFEPIVPATQARTSDKPVVTLVIHIGLRYTVSPVQQCDTSAVTSVICQRKQIHRKVHICHQIQSWPLRESNFLQINGYIWYLNEGLQNTLEKSLHIKINNFSG